jgi:predicted Fe-Mo cluster-binding NifX family protein
MSEPTRIAVPTEGEGGADAVRSAHFGHASSFTIVTVEDHTIVGAETLASPPHSHGGCGMTVKMLADAGVSAAIVVGMGGGPMAAMQSHGISAMFDDRSATPRIAVEAYLAGQLVPFGSDDACQGH